MSPKSPSKVFLEKENKDFHVHHVNKNLSAV